MSESYQSVGEFVLAKQEGEHAYFAKVKLIIASTLNDGELTVTIDSVVDKKWYSAVLFGIEYAWEVFRREWSDTRRIGVHVVAVEWQPSDSTNMTVAFASAHALWRALKHTPARVPILDVSSRSFEFPN